ncbi:MAG TPA: ABC transporter substrate-binding protein [Mycobacteriales bacterium]|jgi:multiple sugar transport system substrate-binding protein
MKKRLGLCLPAIVAAAALALAACSSGSDSSASGGVTKIVVWHGYIDVEGKAFNSMVKQFEKSHPNIQVSSLESTNDYALQKVLTAVRGGTPPDIAYMYGSWSPNIAKIPQLVDLSSTVKGAGWNWNDFYPGERATATVGSKIVGVPALVDNLAIVYNKKLFAQAGVSPPTPSWTWTDFRNAAAKLTDKSKGQFGWYFPADASEDSVWHYEAMLWEAGGNILNPDNTKAAFDSPEGIKALTTLQQMAQDKSVYIDTSNTKGSQLMNAGKIGMMVTGPWDLSSLPNISYGVQIMPTYPGSPGGHQTISGPDNWVVFNNGSAQTQAAETFLKWLTAPAQIKTFSRATGDLPTRASVGDEPGFVKELNDNLPGTAAFVANLANAKKARPQVTQYPKISEALGNEIVAVLLGKATPAAALKAAAAETNQALTG